MPDANPALLAAQWRARADELLVKAEAMSDPGAKQEMREVAARYLLLAQRFEDEIGEACGA